MNRAPRIPGAPTMVSGGRCLTRGVAFEVAVDRRATGSLMIANSKRGCDDKLAPRPAVAGHRCAFTLLEMMIVLVIIALLAAVTMPAFSSAVNEHRVRDDGQQLALMVRTAMIQCAEQHKPYEIDLTQNSMALHPQGEVAKQADNPDATLFKDSGSTNSAKPVEDDVSDDVEVQKQLEDGNKLTIPDPGKTNGWMDMTATGIQWIFQPGELCPATPIRVARGDAYLELNFAALTGNVESEKSYFP